ncbi:hypothetical protein MAXJ12_32794 [Mesorhizobium alhagi CCNWXJ12-2]|uniref:Uncharacterized protein n=1 Tax=Mesorhizobium alhagi CCNWXJ12-2 TaxID=1107882 RepID=H0I261_9HYPH|nr:hypothetical protein MAXJ12_32794 [Mesorhizobium alhagi CCNWXJ12-2]
MPLSADVHTEVFFEVGKGINSSITTLKLTWLLRQPVE